MPQLPCVPCLTSQSCPFRSLLTHVSCVFVSAVEEGTHITETPSMSTAAASSRYKPVSPHAPLTIILETIG